MSSICGIWKRVGEPTGVVQYATMQRTMSIYGRDREFAWRDPGETRVALGGNLLKLLPEDQWDRQPLWNRDRTACLIADIRLDNRPDLMRDLSLVQAEELADSSVLLAAWERWGCDCLDHILGAFAFAVWMPSRQELFAARDHAGERPLFYYDTPELFAFASMPKGLLALPGVFRGLDESHIMRAVVLQPPEPGRTFFSGIKALPMGHWLRATPAGVESRRYWHPSDAPPTHLKTDQDYADGLREVFDLATTARLRTNRSIASELSGGLDSSSVTATAAGLLVRQGKGLTVFTSVPRAGANLVGPATRMLDEGPAAAEVTALYPNIEHILLNTAGVDLPATVTEMADAMDEPVQNGVNQLWVSAILRQAQQRGANVMLQGALGNATISHDGKASLIPMFQRGHWIKFAEIAYRLRRNGYLSIRQAAALAANGLQPKWLAKLLQPDATSFSLDYSPINPKLAEQFDLRAQMFRELYGARPDERQERALFFERFDFGSQNAAVRAVAGIDQRDPCQDKRVFDFCYSIPPGQYLAGGMTRSLVRRAMRGRLPESTLNRTLRGLQAADWYLSIADALPGVRAELERIAESPMARRMLDMDRLRKLAKSMPEGGFEDGAIASAWRDALPRGLAFGSFLASWDRH